MSHFGLHKYINDDNLTKVIREYNKQKLMKELNLSVKGYECILHKFNIVSYEDSENSVKGCYIYKKLTELSSDNFYINRFSYNYISNKLENVIHEKSESYSIEDALCKLNSFNI